MAEPTADEFQDNTVAMHHAEAQAQTLPPGMPSAEDPASAEDSAAAAATAAGSGSGSAPAIVPQGKKKRRRPALSCEQCRRRKIRCDRLQPCSHCIKSSIPDCHYVPTHIPASWAKKAQLQQAEQTAAAAAAAPPPTGPPALPRAILPAPRPRPPSEQDRGAFCMVKAMRRPSSGPSSVASSQDLLSVSAHDWAASMHFLEDKLETVSISNSGSPSSHGTHKTEDASGSTRANAAKTTYYGPTHWLRSTALVCTPPRPLLSYVANWYRDSLWQRRSSSLGLRTTTASSGR